MVIALNAALNEWLAKYARVIHLNAWDPLEMYNDRFHYLMSLPAGAAMGVLHFSILKTARAAFVPNRSAESMTTHVRSRNMGDDENSI